MASVVVQASFSLNIQQLLGHLEQLDTGELEAFHQAVGQLLVRRQDNLSPSSLFLADQSLADESTLPIVEKLIPNTIVLDGDRIQF